MSARPPLQRTRTGCAHCRSGDAHVLWHTREHEYDTGAEDFPVVRCPRCGLVRLDPRPHVDELPRIYPPDYYAYNLAEHSGPGARLSLGDRAKRRMYQRRFAEQVARLGRETGPIRVLDVGCGDGRLLDWFRDGPGGQRLQTAGVELDAGAAEIARSRGHRVVTGRFELDISLEEAGFDLILASHVIEHVADPRAFAARAAELLAPGGLLVIGTPNWDSRDARALRGDWGGNHAPRHWTLYDEATIGDLALRVGLRLERVEYQPNPIFWNWSAHAWLRRRFPHARWPDVVFPPVAIFEPGPRAFVLLTAFTLLDLAQRALTGRTASMSVQLRRPA